MDRARRARAVGDRRRRVGGSDLKRCLPAALLLAACSALTGDFSEVVAIEYTGPPTPRVEEGDTVRLTAVVLGLDGQPLPEVPVFWRVVSADPDSVGFTLDSVTGLVTAVRPGTWSVQGRAEALRLEPPISVTVVGRPDSIGPVGSDRDTVPAGVPESATLNAGVFDITTTVGQAIGLAGKRVRFQLADPAPGSPAAAGVALALPGQAPGPDPHVVDRESGTGGLAGVTARRVAGTPQPDSIVFHARAFTAHGDTVPGSPVRFVVVFSQN
jgi:hypothetical protein